jgi:hypothetical protein
MNAMLLPNVWRRLVASRVIDRALLSSFASFARTGTADALEVKFVIPNRAEYGADWFSIARIAIETKLHAVRLLCLEIQSYLLPIVCSRL